MLTSEPQVVLSDMSAPWEQTSGFSMNTLSNPYHRLMNTSGMPFRDHAGSMVSIFHHSEINIDAPGRIYATPPCASPVTR